MVATPIGNLEDITLRALKTLKEVDRIASEDTRRTRKLLSYYGIHTPLVSYFEQGKSWRGGRILDALQRGHDVALVSEAGTPGISDPGYDLVRRCIADSIPVVSVPGPSALTAALSVSGIPNDRFLFLGFPPHRPQGRKRFLERVRQEESSLVLFESPNRLTSLLMDMLEILGNRKAALCRELTKRFEEVLRGTLLDLLGAFDDRKVRGEVTLVVEGCKERPPSPEGEVGRYAERIESLRGLGLSDKNIARTIAEEEGVPKKRIYRILMEYGEKS